MTFLDYFNATDWGQGYRLLTRGEIPLILQLLILNTIFLIAYVVRSATAKFRLRQSTVMIVQGLLLAANLAVILQEDLIPYIQKYTIL